MKRLLGPVLSIIVLAALGWFAVTEIKKDQREGKLQERDVVFPFAAVNVAELTYRSGDLESTFRRGASGWEKVSGPEGADTEAVTDFLGAWGRVRMLQLVDENPRNEDLARFGLKPAQALVRVSLKQGTPGPPSGHSPSLEIGLPAPLQPSCYARVDGFERVILVSPDVLDLLAGVGRRLVGLKPEEPAESERPKLRPH